MSNSERVAPTSALTAPVSDRERARLFCRPISIMRSKARRLRAAAVAKSTAFFGCFVSQ